MVDHTITTTGGAGSTDFDGGVRTGTATDTDEYTHAAGQIQLSMPIAAKDDNLVSYYRLEADASDETGTNNGTPTAVTYATGKIDNAGTFNGSTSEIATGSAFQHSEVTIMGWAQADSLGQASFGNLFSKYALSTDIFMIRTHVGGKWQVYLRTGNGDRIAMASTTSVDTGGGWQHIAATLSGSLGAVLYVNGSSEDTDAYTATGLHSFATNGMIGGIEFTGASNHFDGMLDEIKIYSRALSGPEISAIYNSGNKYTTSGNWESGEITITPGKKMSNALFTYSGIIAGVGISKVEWLVGAVVKATYDTPLPNTPTHTITNGDLTSGTFNDVNADYTVKVYFNSTGDDTAVITEIADTWAAAGGSTGGEFGW